MNPRINAAEHRCKQNKSGFLCAFLLFISVFFIPACPESTRIGDHGVGLDFILGADFSIADSLQLSDMDFSKRDMKATDIGGMDKLKIDSTSQSGWIVFARGGACSWAHDLALDPIGDIFVTGYYLPGSFSIGSFQNNGQFNPLIFKLDQSGKVQWTQVIGLGQGKSSGWYIAASPSSSVYISGTLIGTQTFGSDVLTSVGTADPLVMAVSGNAAIQWVQAPASGSSNNDVASNIVLDNSGNLYITGLLENWMNIGTTKLISSGGMDFYIAKITASTGQVQWAISIGGPQSHEMAASASLDVNGNLVVAGATSPIDKSLSISPSFTIDSYTVKPQKATAGLIIKVSAYGKILKVAQVDSDMMSFLDMDINTNGEIAISGFAKGVTVFNTIAHTFQAGVGNFIARLDPNFALSWITSFSSAAIPGDLALDSQGNTYVVGSIGSGISIGSTLITTQGGADVYLAKLDNAGKWTTIITGGGKVSDFAESVHLDKHGNVYVTGSVNDDAKPGNPCNHFSGNVVFGSITEPLKEGFHLFVWKVPKGSI